jgi:glycosyltransferase involved in cell wall biosynthesis
VRITVVLVNHNGGEGLLETLSTVVSDLDGLDVETIVVDNASRDGSPALVRDRFPDVLLVEREENGGYARGVNAGLAAATGDVLIVMNPDVEPLPGSLARLAEAVRRNPRFAILGGLVVDDRGRPSPNAFRAEPTVGDVVREAVFLPPRTRRLDTGVDGIVETEVVSGSVMALRRDALETIGPMDGAFFLYREDVEWCRRARRAGFAVGVVTDAPFGHEGGASTRRSEGAAFAARVLSDFRYFCDLDGVPEPTVRRAWSLRLRLRAAFYAIDGAVGRRSRRHVSRRRAALYRLLIRALGAFSWTGGAGCEQAGHPSRLVDLPPVSDAGGRPRVLLIVPDLGYGGVQRRVEFLVKGPLARRYAFEVLVLRELGPVAERLPGDTPLSCAGMTGWRSLSAWRRFGDRCALYDPDIVHSMTFPADLAAFFGFAGRVPWVSLKVSVDGWMGPAHRILERFVHGRTCEVIANGDAVARAKAHLSRSGMLPLSVSNPPMIPIATREPRALPDDRPVRLAVLGRLDPVKRVDLFLETGAELERRHPGRFSLHVLGDGPEGPALRTRAAELGLEGRVTFEGAVADVERALDDVDLVLNFSDREGNPSSVHETLARGRVPVVLRAGGSIDSLPHTLSDCFVERAEPGLFADKVEELVAGAADVLERVGAARNDLAARRRHFESALDQVYAGCLGEPDDRPRVLHIITRLIVGGAQENTIASVERVDPTRFASRLWIGPQTGYEGSLLEDARSRGIAVRVLPHLVREIAPLRDLLVTFELVRLIRRDRYDIVHTHSSKAGIVGRIAARLAGVPHVVHTVHGWGFHEHMPAPVRAVYVWLERAMVPFTERLVAVSHRTTAIGLDARIATEDRYAMIRSGIPTARFHPDAGRRAAARRALGAGPDDVLVGTVGRLSPQKNPHDFVRLAEVVCGRSARARFVYVGDGPMRDEVLAAARERGVLDRIDFLGIRDDVPDLLRAFDVFVLTSLWEGLPRVIPQALATGVPVVAYSVSGIDEAVHEGSNGHLVPPGAVELMADLVTGFVEDDGTRTAMGETALDTFERAFSEDGMIEDLERLYLTLLDR